MESMTDVDTVESETSMESTLRVEAAGEDCWRFVHPPSVKAEEPEFERACRLMASGEEHQAFFLLKEILRRCPAYLAVHNKIAEIHANRGNFEAVFDHYHQATRIGRDAIPEGFEGMLPWDQAGNRPFLEALFGLAAASLRLGRREQGTELLRRLLELDPADTLGAGGALEATEAEEGL